MLYRSVIFTNALLLEAFRYKNKFQLVPFFYFKNARFSEYTTHFPAFIEYEAEEIEEMDPTFENNLRAKGLDEKVLKFGRTIPNQARVKRELLHVLSTLTNFHFFEYSSPRDCWGIQVPDKRVEKLSEEEIQALNNAEVHWTKAVYTYKECGEDLKCKGFTDCSDHISPKSDGRTYFTVNPDIDNNPPLSSASLRVNTLSCVVTRLCQCFDKFFKGLISLHKSEFGLFYDVLSKLWESTIRLEALI